MEAGGRRVRGDRLRAARSLPAPAPRRHRQRGPALRRRRAGGCSTRPEPNERLLSEEVDARSNLGSHQGPRAASAPGHHCSTAPQLRAIRCSLAHMEERLPAHFRPQRAGACSRAGRCGRPAPSAALLLTIEPVAGHRPEAWRAARLRRPPRPGQRQSRLPEGARGKPGGARTLAGLVVLRSRAKAGKPVAAKTELREVVFSFREAARLVFRVLSSIPGIWLFLPGRAL